MAGIEMIEKARSSHNHLQREGQQETVSHNITWIFRCRMLMVKPTMELSRTGVVCGQPRKARRRLTEAARELLRGLARRLQRRKLHSPWTFLQTPISKLHWK